MATKPIDRLLFAQGGLCFFCNQPIHPGEATVEHLVASANGGANLSDNCVVCCKTLNALLGCMSLKEKIRVVLNQKGVFRCPNGAAKSTGPSRNTATHSLTDADRLGVVVADLRKRGAAKPGTLKTLRSTIAALFTKAITAEEIESLLNALRTQGIIMVKGTKVTYKIPTGDA
jgi:septum formation topological specificity factor MinE